MHTQHNPHSLRPQSGMGITGTAKNRKKTGARASASHQNDSVSTDFQGLAGGPSEMLTAKDLQTMLRIDVKTIYSYARRGLIPYVRIQRNLRFPKKQIIEWIERQSFQPACVTAQPLSAH
jgi:hypothetical protein